jgi:CHAD domain-containing protein
MKRGFALSFAQGRGTWRLSEDGKALAEERGEKATLPLEGPLASALGTIPSALPTLALLEATLTDSQYRLTGFAARALRIRTRLWMFRSPLEPAAARGLLRLEASGPVTELSYFSSLLQTRLGFQPARGSVLVKGLALLGHSAPGSGMPAEFRVRPRDSAMDACRAILRGEAWRMRANAPGAMRDLDPEFVHDLRVATRRARSALRLFAEILPAEELLKLRGELGWIARLLGGVRDLDVLGMRLDAVATHPTLRESLRRSREGAQAALAAELQSERFAALLAAVESTGGAPQAGGERGAGDIAKSGFQDLAQTRRNRPAGRFARSRIERIFRKLSPWVARPADDLTDVELHRVRILFKRLRYACEFFRPLLGKDAGSLIEAFVEYQDCLGLHQDAITAERLLTETLEKIPNESRSEDFLLSMGALLQLQRDARQTQREEFVRRWRSAPELLVVWKGVRKNREVSHESSRGL